MQHALRTTGAVLAAQGIRFTGSLLLAAVLVRVFTPEGYGRYAAALALAAQFAFLADLGIPLLLRQRVQPANLAAARPYLVVSLSGLAAMLLIAVLLAPIMDRSAASPSLLFVVTAVVGLAGVQTALGAVLQAMNRAPTEAVLAVLDRIGIIAVAVLTGITLHSLILTVGGIALWRLAVATASVAYLPGLLRKSDMAVSKVSSVVRDGIPYAANVFATAVYQSADIMMAGFLFPATQVGYYAAATAIFIPLTAVASATAVTTQLALTRLYEGADQAGGTRHLRTANTWLLLLGGLFAIAIAGSRHVIAAVLFDDRSGAIAWYLLVLSFLLPLRYLNNTLATSLTAAGRQRDRSVAIGIAAAFNVVSNLIALPALGPRGAALTTILTEFVICAAVARAIWRTRREGLLAMIPAPPAWLGALFLAGAITVLAPSAWALPACLLAGAIFVTTLEATNAVKLRMVMFGVRQFLTNRGE